MWWARVREYLWLREALKEAQRVGPAERARARRAFARARQRRAAAESLWANGHSAEGLRLMRQAFADALEAAATLGKPGDARGAGDAPQTADAQTADAQTADAQTADAQTADTTDAEPAESEGEVEARALAALEARSLGAAALADVRQAAAVPPPPELDDEVGPADARAFQRLSDATAIVTRVIAHATRTVDELRRVRRRRWAGLVAAAAVLLAILGLRVAQAAQEARAPWIGRYYPALDFQGEPEVRGDARLAFDWGTAAPMSDLPADRFSVRWDSCLVLDAEDTVTFSVRSDDGHRVFVDGEPVLDHWSPQPARWSSARRPLSAGPHHIRVEYFEQGGNARVALRLEGSSGDLLDRLRRPSDPDGGCR